MFLPGSEADDRHASDWIQSLVANVWLVSARNASKSEVFSRVEDKSRGITGCCIYFQGHGNSTTRPVNRYITAQVTIYEDKGWDGLDPEDMAKLISLTGSLRWRIFVTDFCYSGNCFALRFVLCLEGDQAEWKEADGWSGKDLSTPVVHFAGSRSNEMVYERANTGGFFTQSLARCWSRDLPLPDLLRSIRCEVDKLLEEAREDAPGAVGANVTQTPQIFSSVRLDLKDTLALIKFQQASRS